MQISAFAQRLLASIFSVSLALGPVTRPKLARHSGLSARVLSHALHELEKLGLLDPQRLRLTLSGLALAVACGASVSARRRRSTSRQGRGAALRALKERSLPRANCLAPWPETCPRCNCRAAGYYLLQATTFSLVPTEPELASGALAD